MRPYLRRCIRRCPRAASRPGQSSAGSPLGLPHVSDAVLVQQAVPANLLLAPTTSPPRIGRCPCAASRPSQSSAHSPKRPGQTRRGFPPRTNNEQSAQDSCSSLPVRSRSHAQVSRFTPTLIPKPYAQPLDIPAPGATPHAQPQNPTPRVRRHFQIVLAKPAAASYRAQTCVANSPRRTPVRARTASHTSRLRFLHLAHPKRPGQIHRGSPPRTNL